MWGSTGRSGYGDSTVGGDYDSWDGVSPNGRQYKNEATHETRNLSGADYWHLRKQNRPTEEIPSHLHILSNGKANIAAYAEPEVKAKKSSKRLSLRNQISLADRHFERMERLSAELEQEHKAGRIVGEEYKDLRKKMDVRLDKAWVRLSKANGWDNPCESSTQKPEIRRKKQDKNNDKASPSATIQGDVLSRILDRKKPSNNAKKDFTIFFGWAMILLVMYKLFF